MQQAPKGTGQWLKIRSPHSGRETRWRLKDLGKPIKDDDDQIFYVLKRTGANGYYASFTRAGGPSQEAKYNALVLKEARAVGKLSAQVAQQGIKAAKEQARGIVPTGPIPKFASKNKKAKAARKTVGKTTKKAATRRKSKLKKKKPQGPPAMESNWGRRVPNTKIQIGMGSLPDPEAHRLPDASQVFDQKTTGPSKRNVNVGGPIKQEEASKLPPASQAFNLSGAAVSKRASKAAPKRSKA